MDDKEDALSCPLCMEKYLTDEPRTPCLLPKCFHTFCRECLAKCGQQALPFECPTCRQPCDVAAADVKLNFAMLTVVEAHLIASGERRLVCQDCDEESDAVKHCADCNLLLCEICSNYHGRSRQFRTHALISVSEMKEKRQAAPKGRRFCDKHRQKELRLYCKTCELLVCDDCCLIKDHKSHDFNLLTDVADEHMQLLRDEAQKLDAATRPLKEAIAAIAEEDRMLGENRQSTKARISEHFERLAQAVRARGEALAEEVEGVWKEKHKVLEGQRKGLEMAVASMSSGAEHAERTARVGDPVEVMEAYSGIVKGLRGLRERTFELAPETTRRLELGWEGGESADGMMERIGKHGKVMRGDADGSACVAEGKGLRVAAPGKVSTFVVRTLDRKGEECTEGGHAVEVRAAANGAPDDEIGGEKPSLTRTSVKDRDDGKYDVEYVGEGAGELLLEVLVNGHAVRNSPFTVRVCQPVSLKMESAFDRKGAIEYIGTGGGQRAFANPHDSGHVLASMSSVRSGDPRRFVQGQSHDGQYNCTNDVAGSWMAVDLKRFRLSPTAYCLRSGPHQGSHKLREWRLEGSDTGAQWTTLREHTNDASLSTDAFSTAAWEVECASGIAFRHFRIRQTGKNSSGDDYLLCTGIELYGELSETGEE